MNRYRASVSKRLQKRRLDRDYSREVLNIVMNREHNKENQRESESSDDDLLLDSHSIPHDESDQNSNPANEANYCDDDFDNNHLLDNHMIFLENSPQLFKGSSISVYEAIHRLSSFCLDANMNKSSVIRLLRIVKSILPQPNLLPTGWKSIMKTLGFTSSSKKTYLCSKCYQQCVSSSNGEKKCCNPECPRYHRTMKRFDIVELIHMDIRSQIQQILIKNYSFLNQTCLYPRTDICYGDDYSHSNAEFSNRITFVVHTDGSPLVKSSKQSLWPCFASLVELPPPIRDYQENIVVMALWASRSKPEPNVFLYETIDELKELIANGTSIFIHDKEYHVVFRTQCFVSDLPAKALFCRTINFNGYFACTECYSTGEWSQDFSMVLYPFSRNDLTPRTHDGYLAAAQEAQKKSNGKRNISVHGVKGFSSLFQIFRYPDQIVFDYMHLVCLNHVPSLIKRWCTRIDKRIIHQIDEHLQQLHLPHNLKVIYIDSISNAGQWKARNNRVFVLNIGTPIMIQYLPSIFSSHFLIYSMAIIILHAPESTDEISLAEDMINFYCQTAPFVYDSSIEIFSLHAHIHLAQQVRRHGGLAHSSAFAFESCIRYIEKKAHGSKDLASQIAYWVEFQSMMKSAPMKLPQSAVVNEIQLSDQRLNPFKQILLEQLSIQNIDPTSCTFYLRFKKPFITFHTTIYDDQFKCRSYIVSFVMPNINPVQYGDLVLFIRQDTSMLALIRTYIHGSKSVTDFVDIPPFLHSKANQLFPFLKISDRYLIIPVESIQHKCVSVPVRDALCLTEIRIDYEHD